VIEDVLALARIPAPTFSEEARIAWLEERLAGAPGNRVRDRAGNLIWTWGEGRPRLLLAAHVDTVFPPGTPLEARWYCPTCGGVAGDDALDEARSV